VPVTGGLLYPQELEAMKENEQFKMARMRLVAKYKNAAGGKDVWPSERVNCLPDWIKVLFFTFVDSRV
jgi:hypothetical protein